MNLAQLTQARWFPSVSKPLLTGLLASGVVFGLHAFGVTSFTSNEANAAIAPLVGFLVTAIAAKPKNAPDQPQPDGPSLGDQLVDLLKTDIAQAIDADPSLFKGMLAQALEQALHPAQEVKPLLGPRVDQGQDAGVIR